MAVSGHLKVIQFWASPFSRVIDKVGHTGGLSRRESLDGMSHGLSSREGKCSETDHCFQLFEGLS